jgi:sulfofructose kinase
MSLPIACVGHASVDHHFEIEAFADHPTKTPAHSYRQIVGGMAANAAVALTRLGAQVQLFGRVGDDAAGDFVCGELVRLGVQARLERVAHASTSISSVVVDARGERQIFNHRGDALARAHGLVVAQLKGSAAVLVDPRWADGAEAALQWARAAGVLSMLDADVAPQADLLRLVPLADWAVFSEPGLRAFAPGLEICAALELAVASGARQAMVTLGARGVRWLQGGQAFGQHAFAVQALDTTGAGDVFHGALLMALVEGSAKDAAGGEEAGSYVAQAVRFASAAAALKCQRRHGVMGTPSRSEVLEFLTAQRPVA